MAPSGTSEAAKTGAGAKGGDIEAFPEDLRIREFPLTGELVTA